MSGLTFDADDPVLAASAWSRIAEPGDETAGALVTHLGATGALRWLADQQGAGLLEPPPAVRLPGASPSAARPAERALAAGVARWSPRLDGLDPRRELAALERTG